MNRRSFFKSLAFLTGGVAAAPTIFVPKLIEVPKWKSASGVVDIVTDSETGLSLVLTREQILTEAMRAFKEAMAPLAIFCENYKS